MAYKDIAFMQDDDAKEALRILYDKHDDSVAWGWPDKTVEVIAWLIGHANGSGEVNETSQAGRSDSQVEVDGWLLTWNLGLGYIGLEQDVKVA